jgi:acetoin utilization deacetylase AcuC-like enzyme
MALKADTFGSTNQDTGIKAGKNYAVNVPLRDGISDAAYKDIFQTVRIDLAVGIIMLLTCPCPNCR